MVEFATEELIGVLREVPGGNSLSARKIEELSERCAEQLNDAKTFEEMQAMVNRYLRTIQTSVENANVRNLYWEETQEKIARLKKQFDEKFSDVIDRVEQTNAEVEMIMDEDSWYVVRHTSGVTKFVGSAKKPIPARESEIKKILHRSTSQVEKIELDVKAGDKVRIISGPFADFDADIIEVYPDKSKLRANVSIFGRETPVELEYKQINKL